MTPNENFILGLKILAERFLLIDQHFNEELLILTDSKQQELADFYKDLYF